MGWLINSLRVRDGVKNIVIIIPLVCYFLPKILFVKEITRLIRKNKNPLVVIDEIYYEQFMYLQYQDC